MKKLWEYDFYWRIRGSWVYQTSRNIKWWFLHRTFCRHDIIKIPSLEPGYYDSDTQILHACFDTLVEFVEGELAWMQLICNDAELKKVPWWQTNKSYRNKHAERLGLAYLDSEMELRMELDDKGCSNKGDLQINHPDTQSFRAQEKKALYLWWKYEKDKEPTETWQDDDANSQREEDNLIRLMKIRTSLWT